MASPHKEIELDRISDLPGNITDQILSYLSIKESAKTSLLSTKWRHKWESVPSLVFDDLFLSDATVDKLVIEIDRVLMLHVGPIHKFELSHSISQYIPAKEIDKWIIYLSRRSIKELVLFIIKVPKYYNTPGCLFSCQSLEHLEMSFCVLKPPSAFKGFKSLTSLTLNNVNVEQNVLENLISSSPLLEKLALSFLDGVNHLNIDAPNLRCFKFRGAFRDVSLENTPRLAELLMYTTTCPKTNDQNGNNGNDSNFLKLMADIPQLGRLAIEGYYLEYLAQGDIPKELPIRYAKLTYLSISVKCNALNETSAFLCLLRSFPNLQELHIFCRFVKIDATVSEIRDADYLNFPLSRLRLVEMSNFCGMQPEFEFIKFMLLISPSLKRMMVKLECNNYRRRTSDDKVKFEMAQKMLRFKRASTEAEIIFFEPQPQVPII